MAKWYVNDATICMRRNVNADDFVKWMHATAARCILSYSSCILVEHKKQRTSPQAIGMSSPEEFPQEPHCLGGQKNHRNLSK